MIPDLSYAIRLQELDVEVKRLTAEVATLPKHVAEIEKKLDSHLRRFEADKAALAANQRERKSKEDDIKVQEQKMSKLRDQMSAAKTNEVYKAFQHEIEFCQKEIRRFEDRILELMESAEALDGNLKAAEAALKVERAQVEAEKKDAESRTAVDRAELETIGKTRAEVVASMTPEAVVTYDRVRRKTGGTVVAEVTEGRCGTCNLWLRPQFIQELRLADKIMLCENCSRILYFNSPQESG